MLPKKLTDKSKLPMEASRLLPPVITSPIRRTKIPVKAKTLITRFTPDFCFTPRVTVEYKLKNTQAAASAVNLPINGMRPPCCNSTVNAKILAIVVKLENN